MPNKSIFYLYTQFLNTDKPVEDSLIIGALAKTAQFFSIFWNNSCFYSKISHVWKDNMDFDFASMDHEYFMREALKEAEIAAQAGEIPVGAVIVHTNRIVGRNHAKHEMLKSDIAHAEMNVLIQAEQYLAVQARDNCVIYTTVEPCVMCLGAIVMSNIAHIVYGMPDNWIKPRGMLNMEYVRRHIKNYLGGILAEQSAELWRKTRPIELEAMQTGI